VSNFDTRRFFRTGSFGNGTSIAGYSDVDYFASIPGEHLTANSNSTLQKVKAALAERFPRTVVGVRCPGVIVPFGNKVSETTEVVPAGYLGKTKSDYKLYRIADGGGGWQRSSPDSHNAYVRQVNKGLGNKAKPLIRFVKAWKFLRAVPISSFYLELRIAKYLEGESSIQYDWDVSRILNWLDHHGLPAVQDPVGISGLVYPCNTEAHLEDAKSKLATAATRARKARVAETAGKTKWSFGWWDLLYAGKFPSYYR
jgi:hypothetical protein